MRVMYWPCTLSLISRNGCNGQEPDEVRHLRVVASEVHHPGAIRPRAGGQRIEAHLEPAHPVLQERSTGGPALLRIERNSGHSGADMIKAEVEKGADRYAFALHHTGGAAAEKAQ